MHRQMLGRKVVPSILLKNEQTRLQNKCMDVKQQSTIELSNPPLDTYSSI